MDNSIYSRKKKSLTRIDKSTDALVPFPQSFMVSKDGDIAKSAYNLRNQELFKSLID